MKSLANQRKIRSFTIISDDNLKILLAWVGFVCSFADDGYSGSWIKMGSFNSIVSDWLSFILLKNERKIMNVAT